jgi:hypothetical protein
MSAIVALRVISVYKGGMLQEAWLLLLAGIILFALSQPVSAASGMFESDAFRVVAATLSPVGGLSILGRLIRIVNAWNKLGKS